MQTRYMTPSKYGNVPRPRYHRLRETPQADAVDKARGDVGRFWGNAARVALPVLGTLAGGAIGTMGVPGIGTEIGAKMGGALGSAAGDALGGMGDAWADEQEDPARMRELQRMALLQALGRG